jgi:hypothetical protein
MTILLSFRLWKGIYREKSNNEISIWDFAQRW